MDQQKVLQEGCDIFISARDWFFFKQRESLPGRVNYLWCHDDIDQNFLEPLKKSVVAEKVFDLADGVVMQSLYHEKRWRDAFALPQEKVFCCANGLDMRCWRTEKETLSGRKPRAYYASAPYRGLEILLELWPIIEQSVPDAELFIFSSLKGYGKEDDARTLTLKERAEGIQGVIWEGGVDRKTLREAARSCRALAYPSAFAETCCLTAMEAMASGCVVVGSTLGALPETAWRNPLIEMQGQWVARWCQELIRCVGRQYLLSILCSREFTVS